MLAPASPRPGSSPGDADRRRRSRRLVVVAVIAAVLALLLPLAIAVLSGDDRGAAPAEGTAEPTVPAVVDTHADATPAEPTPVPDPGTVLANAGPSSPAVGASTVPPAPTPATTAPAAADPSIPAAPPVQVPAVDPVQVPAVDPQPANWMEALRPQVDPEGLATWVFEAHGAWGASDGHTVFIDPDVPADKRWSVMVHEYGHVLQVHHYGSLNATADAMNAIVGADQMDKGPTESNADCIAELLGATWTDYGCQDALRPAAAALVAGDPAAQVLAART